MNGAYVVDAVRTPIGKYGGALSGVRPDDLAALVIAALLERLPEIPAGMIDDVIFGCANQSGEDNRDVARMALLLAGLPVEVPGVTVNRLCGSGLQAIACAAAGIAGGMGDLFIAGGVESMSRAPYVMPKPARAYGRAPEIYDTTLGWRMTNQRLAERYHPYEMGETAENVARKWGVSRERQDLFAYESHMKYARALAAGAFLDEIVPVEAPAEKGASVTVDRDEPPRPDTTLEKLARLGTPFSADGTVTAGNAAGLNDGASALMIVSGQWMHRHGLKPLARVAGIGVAGVHPDYMGVGPVPAARKALAMAGIGAGDLDLVELNEAFASQALVCIDELGLDPARVNVNGGAIAIGHPLGCSGARISTTLLHELRRRPDARFGMAAMCIGVGQGIAVVYERP